MVLTSKPYTTTQPSRYGILHSRLPPSSLAPPVSTRVQTLAVRIAARRETMFRRSAPMAPGLADISVRCGAQTFAQRDADVPHDRIVAIAVDHARGAAVTHALASVDVPNVAEGPVPRVAAPDVQIPV